MFKLSEERAKELVKLTYIDIYDDSLVEEIERRTTIGYKYSSLSNHTLVEMKSIKGIVLTLKHDNGYSEVINVDDNIKESIRVYCNKFDEDLDNILCLVRIVYDSYKDKLQKVEFRIKNRIQKQNEAIINSLPYSERFTLRLSQRMSKNYKQPDGYGLNYAKSYIAQKINSLKCMYKPISEEQKKLDYLNSLPTTKQDIIYFENEILSKITNLEVEDKISYIANIYSKMIMNVLMKDNLDDMPTGTTLRDRLEIAIVMVELSHGFLRSVETREEFDMQSLEWSPLVYHLVKIKVDLFGKEIFSELGLNVLGRNENGDYLIRDENSIN